MTHQDAKEKLGAIGNIPENKNLLSQINFKMIIRRAPTVNYFCTKVNIPGAILPHINQGTPFVNIPQYGDHLEFKPLVITFHVDEDLKNYIEIYQWMRDLAKAETFTQFKELKSHPQQTGYGLRSEIIISILNSTRNANFNLTFYDCIPTELSDLTFDAQLPDTVMSNASMVLRYLNWDYSTNA